MTFQNCLLQIDSTIYRDLLSRKHDLIIAVLAILVASLLIWFFKLPGKICSFIIKLRNKKAKSIWQFEVKSDEIKPGIHFNITDYKKEFLDVPSFEIAREKFNNGKKNLIIIGRSGLGKTRSVFEILSKSEKKYDILIPFLTRPDSFEHNRSFKKRKRTVLFIDDLQKYNTTDINYYLENLISNCSEIQLICACRAEHEENIFSSFQISNLERFPLPEWSVNEGENLAKLLKLSFDEKAFDHTPASLIYKLDKLKEQYKQLKRHQQIILECIKFLKILGLSCHSGSIKEIAEKIFDLDKEHLSYDAWRTEIKKLKVMGFYDISSKGEIVINDVYLNELIELNIYSVFNRYFKFLKSNKNSGALFYCGLYFEKIDSVNAEKCYKEAIAIFPNYASAFYRLGSLYLAKADKEEKSFDLKLAKESISTAINYFISAINLKATDYYFITMGYSYSKAASIYAKLTDKPKEIQNLEQAIQKFSKAIELNPKSSRAYRMRGFCYNELLNFDKAKLDYETSLKINPNSHQTYFFLGILYDNLNQKDKALESYRHCINFKKDYFQAYNNIAHVLHKELEDSNLSPQEMKTGASEVIKNYLLSIWHSRGIHFVAYSNLAHIYIDINEFNKAIKAQNLVIKKSPNYSEPYASRAYAFTRLHRYLEAEKDLLKALELKPNSESIIHTLAFCYQQMGQEKIKTGNTIDANALFQKAIQNYDILMASKNEEQQLSAKLEKAITFEKMGKTDDAFDILNKLFSDNSTNAKILSTIIKHFIITKNDEQILNFLSILLESVKQNKIKIISKQLMEECTLQITRLSRNKILSNNLQELAQLLKVTYPKSYYVYKTSGIYNLNKGIMEHNFENKMNYLSEAEKDFSQGKSIVPNNPVFLKYLGVTNGNICEALKKENLLNRYNDSVDHTNQFFLKAIKEFSVYRQLFFEYCKFLYLSNKFSEAESIEKKYDSILKEQRIQKKVNEQEVQEELNELDELKSKLGLTGKCSNKSYRKIIVNFCLSFDAKDTIIIINRLWRRME
jgi:tetratricopeptide (TPR) repeat protein